MTTQITIRLPDDQVAFIDERVQAGDAPSRAAVVSATVAAAQRQAAIQHDVEILRNLGNPDPYGLADLAQYSATRPLDID